MSRFEIDTYATDTPGVFRSIVFKIHKDDVRSIEDVAECDDLRRLATIIAEMYPDAGVVCYYPNPHTAKEVVYGDAMGLAEVIEAEFEHRADRRAAYEEWGRMLEVTGGSI